MKNLILHESAFSLFAPFDHIGVGQFEGLLVFVHVYEVCAFGVAEGVDHLVSIVLRYYKLVKEHVLRSHQTHFTLSNLIT